MPFLTSSIRDNFASSWLISHVISLLPPSVAVLRYHSVQERPEDNINSIGIGITHSAALFREQIELVARKYHPVSLDDILNFLKHGKTLPRRAVAITFDDGFADNYEIAMPILNHYEVPATFYITVGSVESAYPPWYVRLRHAFFLTTLRQWKDPNNEHLFQLDTSAEKNVALVSACKRCAKLAGRIQHEMVAMIENELEVVPFLPSSSIMLTWDQIRLLRRCGHIIGSHTLTHPNMAYIEGKDILTRELLDSKKQIEKNLGEPVIHFSYPSPMLEPHWNETTISACRNVGYETATTCTSGNVRKADNPLAIKRVWVPFNLPDLRWYLDATLMGKVM